MTAEPRAPRRRGEARQAIVDAARDLFARNGYQGTSIRDIAKAAAVSEALIFRNFQTKDRLFDEAVAQPYQSFLDGFVERWRQLDEPRSNEEMVAKFVTELYEFVIEHRDLLFALVVANRFGDAAPDSLKAGLSEEVRNLAEFTAGEAHWRGLEHVDLEMAVSCTVAMVLAMVLLDDSLFPHGKRHPSKKRLVREMAAYAIAGVTRQAD